MLETVHFSQFNPPDYEETALSSSVKYSMDLHQLSSMFQKFP